MKHTIVLDSGPLGLILQKPGVSEREFCRRWFTQNLKSGAGFFVPEIVVYEIRRELLRMNKTSAVKALDFFILATQNRFMVLTSSDLRLAAELWAKSRQQGKPTADPHALDVDVILCAQVLNAGFDLNDVVVATSNPKHISQFVTAQDWRTI